MSKNRLQARDQKKDGTEKDFGKALKAQQWS